MGQKALSLHYMEIQYIFGMKIENEAPFHLYFIFQTESMLR